jgi:hypothetical protein
MSPDNDRTRFKIVPQNEILAISKFLIEEVMRYFIPQDERWLKEKHCCSKG